MIRIRNIQTRDCHHDIFQQHEHTDSLEPAPGFYFLCEELEEIGERDGVHGNGYIGPYLTLDEACKASVRHWKQLGML